MPLPNNKHSFMDILRKSSFYKMVCMEESEILKHKWIESEKVGHDIGFDAALIQWVVKHRDNWRRHVGWHH